MINYSETDEFKKDLKKLVKRFSSLIEDLEFAKKAVIDLYHVIKIDNQSVYQISQLKSDIPIYKLKKFTCKALKGKGNRSGIRIIYAFFPDKNCVEFIEIYHKSDKDNEDKDRIKEYLKSLK